MPYEFYEVLVPVDSLTSDESYYIRTSYKGASGTDTVLKRKKADYDSDAEYNSSDFKQRYNKSFSKGLRDHRYASTFTLNSSGQYNDDPEGQNYEIISSGLDSTRYLVFILSAVKTSLAYDEETLYQESEVALELISNSTLSSISRVNSNLVSILIGLVGIIIFVATVYFYILPDHVKNKIFGLNENQKAR